MRLGAVPDPSLDDLLSRVSRSFYLSLAVLPRHLRTPLATAYLVARAADTVADTRAVRPAERRELLAELRDTLARPERIGATAAHARTALAGGRLATPDAERRVLERLDDCLHALHRLDPADRDRTRWVLETLIDGMQRDLERFPAEDSGELRALGTLDELDEYCWFAAGCVGEYWTRLTAAHDPALRKLDDPAAIERGVRLGKALQLVNVLRDAAADLRIGRCYLPRALLAGEGLEPQDLTTPLGRLRARPVLETVRRLALDHADAAWPYVLAVPPKRPRERLAALWPLWIALGTLARLRDAHDPLDPERPVKIPRSELYVILAESTAEVGVDALLDMSYRRRRDAAG